MTTRDHLIYQMQSLYSFQRDFPALLDSMIHECGNTELRRTLQRRHDTLNNGLEPLERAINVLGAQYKMERSTLVPAFKEALSRFKHQMNPSQEQLDIHAVLLMVNVFSLTRGAYQGAIELARAVGEQDVTKLLEENLQQLEAGLRELTTLAPGIIQEVSLKEIRRAA